MSYWLAQTIKALLTRFEGEREISMARSKINWNFESKSSVLQQLIIDSWMLKNNKIIGFPVDIILSLSSLIMYYSKPKISLKFSM